MNAEDDTVQVTSHRGGGKKKQTHTSRSKAPPGAELDTDEYETQKAKVGEKEALLNANVPNIEPPEQQDMQNTGS